MGIYQSGESQTYIYTMTELAIQQGDVAALERYIKTSSDNPLPLSLICAALKSRPLNIQEPKMVRLLLNSVSKDTNLDEPCYDGYTLLYWATKRNNVESMNDLMEKGASPNAVSLRNVTPLHIAAQGGSPYVAQTLCTRGAKVRACDEDGNEPIHNAKSREMVIYLIRQGADINARNGRGYTLFMEVVDAGNIPFLQSLLYLPAQVFASVTTDGLMAVAKANKNKEVVEMLTFNGIV